MLLLRWIPRLPPENVTVPFLMYPAWILAAAYLALYPGLWAAAVRGVSGGRAVPFLLAAPGLWVLTESLRGSGPIGFAWGSLGYSQWAWLPYIQIAAAGGIWLVSFLVFLPGLFVGMALAGRRGARAGLFGLAVLAVLLPWAWGRGELKRWTTAPPPARQPVLLVQPNTGNDKWEPAQRSAVISGLVDLTLDTAPATPESTLIVWPETATPTLLRHDPGFLATVMQVPAVMNRPLLTGYPDREILWPEGKRSKTEVRYFNAAGLFRPGDGLVESSAKERLVPFAEYMPIPGLNRVNFGQGNFTPAESLTVYRKGPVPFGVLICFESIFPGPSREMVARGARLLVNITNDQWFGRSAAPWQHVTMAVFRAVENRVGMARAANTGVSCLIEPTGEIRQATALFVRTTVTGQAALGAPGRSFYNRHGDWVLRLAGLLTLGGAFAARLGRPPR